MALQQPCTYHDSWYASLLALAEYFRTCQPLRIRECIQCLEAIVQLTLPGRIGARTHLQLGQIYSYYTENVDLTRANLEKALLLGRSQTGCEDVIGEASCALAAIYSQSGEHSNAKQLLYQALDFVRHQPYWYCRLLLFIAQMHTTDCDYQSAHQVLSTGVEYTQAAGAMYTNVLFLLSRGMLLIIEKRTEEANALLIRANNVLESLNTTIVRKQSLKSFLLVLQVCYCLSSGNVRQTKQFLKELQSAMQVIMRSHEEESAPRTPLECFRWMSKDHLCILVYVVTVLHSMQCGLHDRAQMYAEKALVQIEKLKHFKGGGGDLLLHAFQLLLLEHCAMCRLNTGNRSLAIKEIHAACSISTRFPMLFETHKAQLHTLLGLYAASTNSLPAAEGQFTVALSVARDTDLWTFVNLNLAIVYLRLGKEQEFYGLWERISPTQLQSQSKVLKAAFYYVKGMHEFFSGRHEDSKRQLRDALQLANAEDMNRIASCALVVLGHIFLSVNDGQEGLNMISTALELGRMISDVSAQLWSIVLLRDYYRSREDPVKLDEAYQVYNTLVQNWIHDQRLSVEQPEHSLLAWVDGPCPVQLSNAFESNRFAAVVSCPSDAIPNFNS